tara:strand:+ start:159 stop:281 length:123 start_codon:yes stop_codon:yes gene_type:complete
MNGRWWNDNFNGKMNYLKHYVKMPNGKPTIIRMFLAIHQA